MNVPHGLEPFLNGRGRQRLHRFIVVRFPRLAGMADDLIQDALIETLQSGSSPKDSSDPKKWFSHLCQLIRWRALDRLRRIERQALVSLSQAGGHDGSSGHQSRDAALEDDAVAPSERLGEAERRQRQVLLLSDVLREFTQWCESRSSGFRMKEIYERRLRGQAPGTILEQMQLSRAAFDQSLKRARNWIFERVKQQDVHHSVFQTILRGQRHEPLEVRVPVGAAEARFSSFEEVVRFVVEEMGALCPNPERLAAYRETAHASNLSDVRYHVEAAECRICREEPA
ncbi:MAG: sigma-70 family RNA polymerase sigma factor [Planctomycetota bacterium]|nr:MAG: sigma-70 family RNA polymerase sigma factor [Planctomycetota bacterium]